MNYFDNNNKMKINDESKEIPERIRILKRVKEEENAYRDRDVKRGSFEDFWKDIND